MPVALLPNSTTATSSSTQHGRTRQPPVTSDGELKPHSPTNIPRRKRNATGDDWRNHKDRISSLYRTKRLKDVIAVMETRHQFFATERMYKARFKEWGLEKYITAVKVHKLMQRVEEEQQRQRSPSASHGGAENERVVLGVGEDLDVKRIQKYMKRNPAGLNKLRPASKRSLEVIKALSVDSRKGSSGREKVSIPVAKLEQQHQQKTLRLSLSTFALDWPSEPELPNEVVGLLQAFIDNHFDCPFPFTPVPTSTFTRPAPSKWQPQCQNPSNPVDSFVQVPQQDGIMLDFVLKFRIAHTLLDDGLASEGMQAINTCLKSLAFYTQQAQTTNPMDTRPATRLILWALSAASEMMSDFKQTNKLVLQMLLQQMTALCAGYQPTMAELIKRTSQLGASGQVAMLRLVRYSVSQALFGAAECKPAFETYSKTVSIAESPLSPADRLQALQSLANDPIVHDSPVLGAWMDTRIALSVSGGSSLYISSLGPYGTTTSPSWHAQGLNRMAEVLGTMDGRVEWHKAAGNWQLAQQLQSRYGSIAQTVWGYNENAEQDWGARLDIWSSPELMTSSLTPAEPSMFHMALPGVTVRMNHLMGEIPGEIPGWEEWQQPQHQHQGQVAAQREASSMPAWNVADASQWQMDTDLGSEGGRYNGSYEELNGMESEFWS
ncbi:hypothetical protein Daus18300_013926 [Diaporthe australafricana]|uniref:Clr5 domain-containing protein n=1 Tax=Diaporthe australafricana TaxID=127596 RepID=A0ABR3VX74_9PEZI